jgi:hypothetical protein
MITENKKLDFRQLNHFANIGKMIIAGMFSNRTSTRVEIL